MLNYQESLTFFYHRPVFGAFIVILLILMAIVLIQGNTGRFINWFAFRFILSICFLIPAMLLYMGGYIVDEFGLGGDPVTFDMFLIIAGLCVVNLIVYKVVSVVKSRKP